MASGIYQIENQINGKRYIGSAVNLKKRWRDHLGALRRGRHHNRHLQSAFDKYGEMAFIFVILEDVEEHEKLITREQHYLNILNPEYNILSIAESPLGVRRTKETRAKMRNAWTPKRKQLRSETQRGEQNHNYGKSPSKETRAKMRAVATGERNHFYGKHHSIVTKQKISDAKKGTNVGEQNSFYGKQHSAEARAKQSVANSGKRHPMYDKHPSADTLAKLSAAKTGERHPMYGKHHSEETKRKISEGLRIYWRRKRAEEQEIL